MSEVFEKAGRKYWKDGEGALVPENYVSPDDKHRDKLVEKIHKRIDQLRAKIEKEKEFIGNEINKYLESIAAEHKEEWEGNATLYNFAKTKQIEVKISKRLVFNEKLQIAKTKIDKLIMKWSDGSNDKIVALVNKAFKVDNKGNADSKLIFGLRSLNIKDKEWKEAMDLIADAVEVDSAKTYFNFRYKDGKGQLRAIPLNFSAL